MSPTSPVPSAVQAARGAQRYAVLLGAVIVQLILGTVYGYSIFWQPLEAELGLNPSQAKYAFSICVLSFAAVMVVAGRIQDVLGPRIPAIIGGVLMGLGFITAGLVHHPIVFFLAHSVFTGLVALVLLMLYQGLAGPAADRDYSVLRHVPLAIVGAIVTAGVLVGNQYVGRIGEWDRLFLLWGTIGFLAGAGTGFAYVCPIAALVKWFPERKGLVSGIAVAGFGFGAFLFSHKSLAFSAESYIRAHGITELLLVHGLVALVAITLGALLLRNPPGTALDLQATESAWHETLRHPAFYVLWLMFFSGATAGLMVIGILKPFAGSQLVQAALAEGVLSAQAEADLLARGAAAVGWLAVFNAVGRIVWGFASDRVGRTAALVAMFIMQAASMLVLGGMTGELSLAVAAAVVGFNFDGNFALFPSATADLFGARNLGANYGWVFTSYGVAGVVGVAAGNLAMQHTGSYVAAFDAAAALCVLSAVLALALPRIRRRAQAAAARPVASAVAQ
jgi:OFA family oxalate/formate antiporter-like MFS transporter